MKDNDGEKCDGDARYDKVDCVEQSLATDRDVERDVWLRFRATVKALDVFTGRHAEDVPLDADVEVLQINALFNDVRGARPGRLLVYVDQIYLYARMLHTPRSSLFLIQCNSGNVMPSRTSCRNSRR